MSNFLLVFVIKQSICSNDFHYLEQLLKTNKSKTVWNDTSFCDIAAAEGHLECLKILHENGFTWTSRTTNAAAKRGHLDCLKYAYENGCPWDKNVCENAVTYGFLDILKYAHENGCPWDKNVCEKATIEGNLKILKYAHENGCPWDTTTLHYAAYIGYMDCLKYIHENGCDWDENICVDAVRSEKIECLIYVHQNGCPWNSQASMEAIKIGNIEMLKYMKKNDCPIEYDIYSIKEILMIIKEENIGLNWNGEDTTTQIKEYVKYLIICLAYVFLYGVPHSSVASETKDWSDDEEAILVDARMIAKAARFVEKGSLMFKIKKRNDVIGKELVEKTCHPTRFFDWCLDFEEQNELKESFRLLKV